MREFCVLKLKGIDNLDQAGKFTGQEIWVREEDLEPLDRDKYYLFQLDGCSVITEAGNLIGVLRDILFIEGNDLLVVEKGSQKILIPFTESICTKVDLGKKKVVIDPPDGLLDLNDI